MQRTRITGLGALNIDRIYIVDEVVAEGETVIQEAGVFPGGSAANTIYGLARLGFGTGFIGVVGKDTEGKIIINDFKEVSVDTSRISVKPLAITGKAICLSDKRGRRSLYILPGANSLLIEEDLDIKYINESSLLHISSFVDDRQLKVITGLISKVNDDVIISFAPGMLFARLGLKTLSPVLKHVDYLFLNRDELAAFTTEDNLSSAAATIIDLGCRMVITTMGKNQINGRKNVIAYIKDREGEQFISSSVISRTPMIDTTGAGDAFTAGYIYGIFKGKSIEECSRLGDITAILCISKKGARDGLPTAKELDNMYKELY